MSDVASVYVLDSSAVIAFLRGEPGADEVARALLSPCYLSAVNHIEVLTKMLDKGVSAESAANALLALELRTVALDESQATQAAWLRSSTKHLGLSLGGRACLALAQSLNATVLTADRAWTQLSLGLTIESIRP